MDKVAFEIALAVRDIHTTAQLSDITGISRQTLAAIRNQKTEASQESAEQIRRTLDLASDEYSKIFPMQAEITAVKEKYLRGTSTANV
jgi:transcriptional regulator with XRE-family HTH domain